MQLSFADHMVATALSGRSRLIPLVQPPSLSKRLACAGSVVVIFVKAMQPDKQRDYVVQASRRYRKWALRRWPAEGGSVSITSYQSSLPSIRPLASFFFACRINEITSKRVIAVARPIS
jgi:hypothetical protein